MAKATSRKANRYLALIEKVFFDHYAKGSEEVYFERDEFVAAAKSLRIVLPKNLGDAIYSVRYRMALPPRLIALQPAGFEWIIEGVGRARYAFRLVKVSRIVPNPDFVTTKIPDATPELISACSLGRASPSGQSSLQSADRYFPGSGHILAAKPPPYGH